MPKKSKKKKEKTFKKRKHSKKKSKRRNVSETESSSQESSDYEWTEKLPLHQRDEWMSEPFFVPVHSKSEINDKDEKRDHSRRDMSLVVRPGSSSRELNPYWKDGGCGLPPYDVEVEGTKTRKENKFSPEIVTPINHPSTGTSESTYSSCHANIVASKIKPKFMRSGNVSADFESYNPTSSRGWRKTNKIEIDAAKKTQESDLSQQTFNTSLTEEEMNSLASKILRAKIMKNDNLVKELSEKLERARSFREEAKHATIEDRTILLTRTNTRGITLPVRGETNYQKREKKFRNYETHVDGKRVRYFEDDDKYSLAQMYEKEMSCSTADHNAEFLRLAAKKIKENSGMEDLFMEQSKSDQSSKEKDLQNAISEYKKTERALDSCLWCLSNKRIQKHLIISTRLKSYLSLPYFQPLTEGHCLIAPIYHSTCSTLVDEDVWEEILMYCKNLTNVFRASNQDVVFFETAMNFKHYPHMTIHCVPLPFENGNLAPIYFKKAILESEKEWAQNKQLIDVSKFNVKRVIPRGLPYFVVNFGLDYGFAHVIEDENNFPKNFAQEIIGGILDLDHHIWRKQHVDDLENQCKRVNRFKNMCNGTELLNLQ